MSSLGPNGGAGVKVADLKAKAETEGQDDEKYTT